VNAVDELRELGEALRRTRAVDLTYTISAQTFVALIPLVLVLTGAITGTGDSVVLAKGLVERFGLVGAAKAAMEQLFTTPGAGSGVYWLGLLVTLISVVSLSRRVARTFGTLWDLPAAAVGQRWRGLVWVVVQLGLSFLASGLRSVGHHRGGRVELVLFVALVVFWGVAEYGVQWVLTAGLVARDRLLAAAAITSVGRIAVLLWSGTYLAGALARQADHYGPIGVVFGLFTWILVTVGVLVLGTLLAAVLTRPRPQPAAPPAPAQPAHP